MEQQSLAGVEEGDHKKSKHQVSGIQGGDNDSDVLNKPAQTNHRKLISLSAEGPFRGRNLWMES